MITEKTVFAVMALLFVVWFLGSSKDGGRCFETYIL